MARKRPAARRSKQPPADPADARLTENLGQRVRALRKERNWTLNKLSAVAGVSRSMISQIERADASPTLAVACRLANAFESPLSRLVEAAQVSPDVELVRADDRKFYFRSDRHCQIRTLSPLHLEKQVEFYELLLHPGGSLKSAAHPEGTREFLTVQKGRVKVDSGGASCELARGDSAHYPADAPHRIHNVGRGEALTFLVVTYRD